MEWFAASIIVEPEFFQKFDLILEREFHVHFRGDGGEDLSHHAAPHVFAFDVLGIGILSGEFVGIVVTAAGA
ncbi:hypothetical protein SDC9_199993 [bioreactor metagenome]|uniref:Uncharacterized protein n=1 Tax=bioreactor metagenome TaxID=1076179 RepID=A0A645IM51_9ZZZZ